MQQMTQTYCTFMPAYNNANPDSASTITLTDTRNGQQYDIRKLQDNNCWMIDNLKLELTNGMTLEPSTTNVASNITVSLAASNLSGNFTTSGYLTQDGANNAASPNLNAWRQVDPGNSSLANSTNCQNGSAYNADSKSGCGYLYNYYTATAGTGLQSQTSGIASGSICPAGWRLPSGYVSASDIDNDFPFLNSRMNDPNATTGSTVNYYTGWMRSGSFRTAFSGYWRAVLGRQNVAGYLWSSNAVSSADARDVDFESAHVYLNDGNFRGDGLAVRCVTDGGISTPITPTVTFGTGADAVNATIVSISADNTTITAIVPAHGSGEVNVTVSNGIDAPIIQSDAYTYIAPIIAESNYRFYDNANSLTPGNPRAADNTPASVGQPETAGQDFRLRTGVENRTQHTLSNDDGYIWTELTDSGQHIWTDVAISDDGTVLLASADDGDVPTSGLYVSLDSGDTWSQSFMTSGSSFVHVSGNGQYMMAMDSYEDSGTYGYRSDDYGATWYMDSIRSGGSSSVDVYSLDGSASGKTLATADTDGISISSDYGVTWTSYDSGQLSIIGGVSVLSVANDALMYAIDEVDNNSVLIHTISYQESSNSWQSNGGVSLNIGRNYSGVVMDTSNDGQNIVIVNNVNFLALFTNFWYSDDGGLNFTETPSQMGYSDFYYLAISGDGTSIAITDYGGSVYTVKMSAAFNATLQYSPKSTPTCSTQTTGWQDVTTTSDIAYKTNPSVTSGTPITTTPAPTAPSGSTWVAQKYVSSPTDFTLSNTIPVGSSGLWDFSLTNLSATANTTYCFRIINSDGSVLDQYNQYPEITTGDDAYLTLTLNSNLVEIGGSTGLTPTNPGTFGTGSNTLTTTTNNATGYLLSISTNQPSTNPDTTPNSHAKDLKHTTLNQYITSTNNTCTWDAANRMLTNTTSSLTNNTWGFTLNTTNRDSQQLCSVPTKDNPLTIKQTTIPNELGDNTNVFFGAKVDTSLPSGKYQTTVVYTVVVGT